jgi:Zn-dependent peptidase ImmA (M78 family)/transcriptional regulator with XRE-family HTH domain
MRASFQPVRLQQARYLSRMTLEELGQKIEVKRQSLSQFEKGHRVPSPDTLRRISVELKSPVEFFLRPQGPIECSGRSVIHYRSLNRTREIIKEQQRASAILDLSAALTDSLEEHIEYQASDISKFSTTNELWETDLDDLDKVEEMAAQTRKSLGLGEGPISDVTLLIENEAVPIVHAPLPEGMEGMSAWYAERPFIVVSSTASRTRARLNVAHEFGHLVLHRDIHEESQLDADTFKLVEAQAWRFAEAFLLPAKSFLGEAYNFSLDALLALKEKWGVSVAAMIKRLATLTVIDKEQERYLYIQLRRRNWHRREPGDDAPREKSRLLGRAAQFLADNEGLPIYQFASESRLPLDFLASALELQPPDLLPPPPKNVVQFSLKSAAN